MSPGDAPISPAEWDRLRAENCELKRQLREAQGERHAAQTLAAPSRVADGAGGPGAAQETETLWRAVFDGASDGMLLATDTHCVDANRRACELLSVTRDELVGQPLDSWGWPGSASVPDAQLFLSRETTLGYFSVAGGEGKREVEYSTTGDIVPGLHLSVLRDVTERRRAEREMVSQQELFQQVMDAIDDMIFVKGPGSKLLWANKVFCDCYGMSMQDLRGLVDAPFVPPDQTAQYVKDDLMVFETGRAVSIPEESVTCHDGRILRVNTVKSPIFDARGKVTKMVGVCRDITEQRQLEMDLRQAQKLEAVGALASGIAHEINTPIQYIGDQTQFLREAFLDLGQVRDAYRHLADIVEAQGTAVSEVAALGEAEERADVEFLFHQVPGSIAAIQDGVSRVARLVQAMKEFGHPDRGERRNADLNRAIATTLILANNQLKYVADVETEFGDIPEVSCWLSELNQVFLNVLVNAGHAIADVLAGAPAEGGRGKVKITTRRDGGDVVVSISDTGGGIPPQIRHQIFDPFFTTKDVGRGTGQGLAIARRIVDKHGGSLTFDTTVGVGTTFHIRVPVAPPT